MKAKFLHGSMLWTFLATAALSTSCSDDNDYKDVDGQTPTVELKTEHIRTLAEHKFELVGKVADKDGIRSIRLQCADLYLDKTIDLVAIYAEPLYEYGLNYAFTIPAKATGERFTMKVTITDLGGRTIEKDVLITLDGDYTQPSLIPATNLSSATVNVVLADGNSLEFSFLAEDNKGLSYLELEIPELSISERVDLDGEGTLKGTFKKTITFPSDKLGTYPMTIRAVDWAENVTEKSYSVLISRSRDYMNMYLVDFEGTDNALLTSRDAWGVPMPIERITNFQYKARYYAAAANTPIRFLPSKENFNVCFGDDKENPGQLTGTTDHIQPIILPKKGYYEITLNIEKGEYTVTPYTPQDAAVSSDIKLGFVGGWFDNAPGWGGPSNVYMLAQDSSNPYLFTAEVTYTRVNSFDVTISPYHAQGWWTNPSWRFDGKNERFGPGETVVNSAKLDIPIGKYIFIFDTHLCQSKLVKKNN